MIEVDPHTHNIVWSFGNGSSFASPASAVAPNDAGRVDNLTLIAGTGAPAGSEPTGITGSGPILLNTPVQATFLPGNTE